MNSAPQSMLDTEETTQVDNSSKQQISTFAEILTLTAMFLATSAVVLLLSLSWVL
ncbi:hypothetical protein VII00023_17654 [Vibrio ichthyoenteri ATCC 700023]|uniref:Uncharacterized protein n=1 Tax=Vibrio ichthyoenteri ATCC 700023 TaxID=870968 RepID=F9RYB2_9VIBR|nr:hypothetical protein [Vibrio ichthyoenteri]EGU46918.1 hypothetical protein VII00023_17654 [Vibrio ichthyoenteri ATCC 700023]